MQNSDTDWAGLMRAAIAGDGQAYARFLHAVTPVLRRIIRARGQALPPDSHEDIVQEVLLALHHKRHTWAPDQPIRPWIYAITRYKVVDAFRRRGRALHLPIEDFAEVLEGPAGPDSLALRDAEALIAQLDPRAADVVRAISLREEPVAEVGARLNLSDGAVRVVLHRALKRLAELGRRGEP